MTNRRFDADEAAQMGLVTRVVADGDTTSEAEVGTGARTRPDGGVRRVRRLLLETFTDPLEVHLERELRELSDRCRTADVQEASLEHVLDEPIAPDALDIKRPGGGGWSNDTVLVGVGDGRRVVVRRQPASASMFPRYDLRREYECLGALNSAGRAPVPALIGEDLAGATTGRPAFVMAYVDGRVPADDRPTFVEAGWLHDAAPAEQRRFHKGLLTSMAAVNATPADDNVVALLRRPGTETSSALIEDLATIWAFDQGDVASPIIDETFDHVRTSIPTSSSPDVMLWGDARPANVIVDAAGFAPWPS